MSILVFALLIVIVAVIVMWAVWYIPFPPSPIPIKECLMVLVLLVAALVILSRAGMLASLG